MADALKGDLDDAERVAVPLCCSRSRRRRARAACWWSAPVAGRATCSTGAGRTRKRSGGTAASLEFVSIAITPRASAPRSNRPSQKLAAAYQRKGDAESQGYFDRAVKAFDQRLAVGAA